MGPSQTVRRPASMIALPFLAFFRRTRMKSPSKIARASLLVLLVTACGTADEQSNSEVDPLATIESYFNAYNDRDFDEMMAHFSNESVIVGHPTDADSAAPDIYEIRELHKEDLQFEQQYRISNLASDGTIVTWDSIWGEDGCVAGHAAVVEDGIILEWTWGHFVDCSEIQ